MQIENLNIVFKISERCNLKCDYCYFFFGGDDTWKKHPPLVSPKVIEDLGAFSARAARDHKLEVIDIVFHGGEPLLMSKPRFSEMCDALRRHENGFRFSFALQTNGVLVDDGWIDIFERHRITVGVSLDGPPPVNDLHRLDLKGRSSYDATVAGLRTLQAAAAQKRVSPPGLLSVISPFSDGAATYRHFVDDLGVRYMSFLTPDYSWDSVVAEPVIRGVERFLLSALRAWLGDKNPKIKVRVFSELLAAMLDPRAMGLIHTFRDDYRSIISVSSNGDLGPEDTLRTLDPRFASMGLNVASHNLSDVLDSDVWQQQADALSIKPQQCKTCDWWNICKAGRPAHRYSKANGFSNHSLYCSGLKDTYAELGAFVVRNGTPFAELALRLAGDGLTYAA
jgi:uncharacterized protein